MKKSYSINSNELKVSEWKIFAGVVGIGYGAPQ